MHGMDTIASAIRKELAEIKKREQALEKALALVAPEAVEASAPAATPQRRRAGRPKAGTPTSRDKVLAHLQANPEGVNQADFHNQLGIATSIVANLMKDMETKGQITRSTFQKEGDKKSRRFVKLVSA